MNKFIIFVVLLSALFVIGQTGRISWECTWQCTSYNVCTHRGSFDALTSIFKLFGRRKRSDCPPYPRGCDCNNFG